MRKEFLDTDSLRQLHYGNLVLRHHAHLFLGGGVLVAITLLLIFWFITSNLDILASGGRLSCKKSSGEAINEVTTMISFAPSHSSASQSLSFSAETARESPSLVGNILPVHQDALASEQTAATQKETRQAVENHNAKSAQGSETASGTGNSRVLSGMEGFGEDVSLFGACEKMPAFLEQKKPSYPEPARLAGITGKVFVKVLIAADGHPVKAIVMKRIPEECTAFDSVALKSVLESTYYPAVQNGQPVKVWCIIPVSFSLT